MVSACRLSISACRRANPRLRLGNDLGASAASTVLGGQGVGRASLSECRELGLGGGPPPTRRSHCGLPRWVPGQIRGNGVPGHRGGCRGGFGGTSGGRCPASGHGDAHYPHPPRMRPRSRQPRGTVPGRQGRKPDAAHWTALRGPFAALQTRPESTTLSGASVPPWERGMRWSVPVASSSPHQKQRPLTGIVSCTSLIRARISGRRCRAATACPPRRRSARVRTWRVMVGSILRRETLPGPASSVSRSRVGDWSSRLSAAEADSRAIQPAPHTYRVHESSER